MAHELDLDDIRGEIRLRLGANSSDPALTDADLTTIINSALRSAANLKNWPWHQIVRTFATVADTASYAFATHHRKTLYLMVNDDQIKYRTQMDMIKWTEISGRPRYWTNEASQIKLFPTPDDIYTVTEVYLFQEEALATGTDEPAWPGWAVDWIILTAAQIAGEKINSDVNLAAEMQRVWVALQDETNQSVEGVLPRRRTDFPLV